jgi:hypothetical protein
MVNGVTRGPISWNYFYIALGFALSIWGTIMGARSAARSLPRCGRGTRTGGKDARGG